MVPWSVNQTGQGSSRPAVSKLMLFYSLHFACWMDAQNCKESICTVVVPVEWKGGICIITIL